MARFGFWKITVELGKRKWDKCSKEQLSVNLSDGDYVYSIGTLKRKMNGNRYRKTLKDAGYGVEPNKH